MIKKDKKSSTAKGPASGYIYQFEVALSQLSSLNDNQSILIESIDDVAKIDENGTYIATIQAKHSISTTGKSFGNTSEDLWKTFEIWITNIKNGKLNSSNKFYANSNKGVVKNSLIDKMSKITYDEFLKEISSIEDTQKIKLQIKESKNEKATSIKIILSRIEYVLLHKKELKIIFENFSLLDNQINIKKAFFNAINLGGFSDEKKDDFYFTFLGWIQDKSKEFWLNKSEAKFSKFDFDIKYNSLRDIHLINKLYFRKKDLLENSDLINTQTFNKNQLFIKQIEDIDRFQKDVIIEEAIIDYLCRDLEMVHLLSTSSPFTRDDFEKFEKKCIKKWSEIVRKNITEPNLQDYTFEQLNQMSITIYDEIMIELRIDFQDDFGFNDSNKYIQNGTFLSLSDKPLIGWHPEWEKKYK